MKGKVFDEVGEAEGGDEVDLAEGFETFFGGGVGEAGVEGGEDFGAVVEEADADDEGKVEALLVLLVEGIEESVRVVVELIEAEAGLFAGGFGGEGVGAGEFAGEVGVGADEGVLLSDGGLIDGIAEGGEEVSGGGEGELGVGASGDPG
jgi:hypothetical protein